jgi:hypothetical protein
MNYLSSRSLMIGQRSQKRKIRTKLKQIDDAFVISTCVGHYPFTTEKLKAQGPIKAHN